MELLKTLLPLIGIILIFAINHYYIKDSRKMLKIVLSITIPFMFILVLGMEFGCIPTEI